MGDTALPESSPREDARKGNTQISGNEFSQVKEATFHITEAAQIKDKRNIKMEYVEIVFFFFNAK